MTENYKNKTYQKPYSTRIYSMIDQALYTKKKLHSRTHRFNRIKNYPVLVALWQNMSRTLRPPSHPAAPGPHSGTPIVTRTAPSHTGDGAELPARKRSPVTAFCSARTLRFTRKERRSSEWCTAPSLTTKSPPAIGSNPWRPRPLYTWTPGDADYTPDNQVTTYSLP